MEIRRSSSLKKKLQKGTVSATEESCFKAVRVVQKGVLKDYDLLIVAEEETKKKINNEFIPLMPPCSARHQRHVSSTVASFTKHPSDAVTFTNAPISQEDASFLLKSCFISDHRDHGDVIFAEMCKKKKLSLIKQLQMCESFTLTTMERRTPDIVAAA